MTLSSERHAPLRDRSRELYLGSTDGTIIRDVRDERIAPSVPVLIARGEPVCLGDAVVAFDVSPASRPVIAVLSARDGDAPEATTTETARNTREAATALAALDVANR